MKKTLIGLMVFIGILCFGVTSYAVEVESLGLDIHGFVSQGFLKSTSYNYLANDANRGSIQYRELGVNVTKQVTDKLRIGAQLFARDLGDTADNKITVDWAYGDYRFKDWLGIRIGKVKNPIGLYNETRDVDMLRACIVLPQGIYSEMRRDTLIATNGAALYGTTPATVVGSLEYVAQAGAITADLDSGVSKQTSSLLGSLLNVSPNAIPIAEFNNHNFYIGALRWNTPLPGLALKASLWQQDSDIPMTISVLPPPLRNQTMNYKTTNQAYSAEFIWKNLTLSAEYMTQKQDYTLLRQNAESRFESYYAMGSYRFTNWLELGGYYSETFSRADDKTGDRYVAANRPDYLAWQKDAAAFVRFDITSYLVFKVEGHYVNGVSDLMLQDNPTMPDSNWWYFAAKATLSF